MSVATKQLTRRSKKSQTFVILSVAKNPYCHIEPQAKYPQNLRHTFKFMDTSPKAQYDKKSVQNDKQTFVILSLLQKGEKSIRISKYALNLWILRFAQYDKTL